MLVAKQSVKMLHFSTNCISSFLLCNSTPRRGRATIHERFHGEKLHETINSNNLGVCSRNACFSLLLCRISDSDKQKNRGSHSFLPSRFLG